jgi:Cu/Ag efflux pump CusA
LSTKQRKIASLWSWSPCCSSSWPGLYSYAKLPREAAPDIQIPYIFVTTDYEGVAPEDMEKLVTVPWSASSKAWRAWRS